MPKLSNKQAKAVEEAEERELVLLDDGTYMGALQSVKEEKGDKGPYWVWEFLLVEDADGEELENQSRVWENTSLSEKALFRLKAMFAAFEVDPDTDTDEILGQYVWVDVGHEVQKAGSRAGQLRNVFLAAHPIEEESE